MDRLDLIREKLRRVAQDPDVDDKKGTQPKKYYSGVKKSKKDARDAHFKRGASMSDDNPAAYKPAPGDKDKDGKMKKTKPSKHTNKFKQMYGEQINEVTFGNPDATEADALPPKVVNRFVKEYKNADKLQTLVIRTRSKIRGSEQRETLDDLNKKTRDFKFALSDCIETGSTIVMDYTPEGDDLYEGKLVTGVDSVLSVITKKLKAEMGKRYKQNAEAGMKYINSIAKMVGMTASDKGQQKNKMFLRMSEETLDEKAPNTADAMKRHKAGKAGFTDKAHLKAKGLIPRSDGTKRKSPKYEEIEENKNLKKKLSKIKGLTQDQIKMLLAMPPVTLQTVINQLSTLVMSEKLGKNADAGDYIDDFRKSDAPQFKGKSDKKIRDMAIAAYLDAKDKK